MKRRVTRELARSVAAAWLAASCMACFVIGGSQALAQSAVDLKPSPQQTAWQDLEFGRRVENGHWQTVAASQAIGHKKIDSFAPVTAERVRLNILSGAGEVRIREFQLFSLAPSR